MSVLFLAVPIALLLASSAVAAFLWAVRRGQLDDLETPPLRMLLDDDASPGQTATPAAPAPGGSSSGSNGDLLPPSSRG